MKYATDIAHDMVAEYTSDEKEQASIRLFLSEEPIGDEYGMLSKEEWALGEKYVEWLEARGVTAFAER